MLNNDAILVKLYLLGTNTPKQRMRLFSIGTWGRTIVIMVCGYIDVGDEC